MKVTRNQLIAVIGVLIAVSAVLFVIVIINIINTGGYVTVEATRLGINTEHHSGRHSHDNYYCIYEFSYGGKMYTIKKQVFTDIGKYVGGTDNIRVNPDNPEEFEDTYTNGMFLILANAALLAATACIKALEKGNYIKGKALPKLW